MCSSEVAGTLRFRQTLPHDDDEGLAGVRPGTVAAGVVAVVILLGAGAVALSGKGSPSAGPTTGPVAPTTSAPPLEVDGPVYSGYERSQIGALIAAVQLGTRYLLTPGDLWREVLQRQALAGVGRDVFARNRATVDADDPPGTYGQPAGFRFVAFTPDVASIQLVSRFPTSGNLQVVTVTVKWARGDWRLELQPDGGSSPTAQAVRDLDGFVVWGI